MTALKEIFRKILPLLSAILLCLLLGSCDGKTVLTGDDLEAMWAAEEAAQDPSAQQEEGAQTAAGLSIGGLGLAEVPFYLDGQACTAYGKDGAVWVECRALADRFPGFSWQAEGGTLTFSDLQGHQAALRGHVMKEGEHAVAEDPALILSESDCWVSPELLAKQLSFRYLFDAETGAGYLSPAVDTSLLPAGRSVPVLMYHAVADDPWGWEGLFMTPEGMRSHLQWLLDNGYDPIFFSDLAHIDDYDRPVILTFDDGYNDNYTELLPILQEFGAKATVFVIAGNVDVNPNFMTSEQVKALADSGLVDIQSHTVNHMELASLTEEQQLTELRDSQLMLARITGKVPYVISYPAGKYNDTTLRLGPEYYDFGVKSRDGLWTVGDNFFTVDRFPVYRGAGPGDIQALVE